jgi:hypothetical protein
MNTAKKQNNERKIISPFRKSSKPKWSRVPVTVSKPSIEEGITPGGIWNLQGTMVIWYYIKFKPLSLLAIKIFKQMISTTNFCKSSNHMR